MGITKRCKELNLLNHLRQTKKIDILDIAYVKRKDLTNDYHVTIASNSILPEAVSTRIEFNEEPDKSLFSDSNSWICILYINNEGLGKGTTFISCDTSKKRALEKLLVKHESYLRKYV